MSQNVVATCISKNLKKRYFPVVNIISCIYIKKFGLSPWQENKHKSNFTLPRAIKLPARVKSDFKKSKIQEHSAQDTSERMRTWMNGDRNKMLM